MKTRLRLLKAANALLYMGPLLAGLAGYGWVSVPIFAAIFTLWQMILRPHEWQGGRGRVVPALGQVLLQVLLVTGCFAAGRALGGIFELRPGFQPMLPVALSFLAIPVSRLLWDPWRAKGEDRVLDHVIARESDNLPPEPTGALTFLLDLPGGTPVAAALAAMKGFLQGPQAWANLDVLLIGIDTPGQNRALLRRALILWATEPEVVAAGQPHGTVETAWALCGMDEDLLRLFLPRAHTLIAAFPDCVLSFPPASDLRPIAPGMTDTRLAFQIEALADAIETVNPPELRGRRIEDPRPAPILTKRRLA